MFPSSPNKQGPEYEPHSEVDTQAQPKPGPVFIFSTNATGKGEPSSRPRTLAPNLRRRSHKKSRAGCLNCKARKIKCGENKPTCDNCAQKALDCVYPDTLSQRQRRPPLLAARSSSTTPPTTSMTSLSDMTAFHQFLTFVHPHLPSSNNATWTLEIPQLKQQYDYLMHALLALNGSHSSRTSVQRPSDQDALIHRGQAIAGLNQALAQDNAGPGESTAMLATCYALTFQSVYLSDGLPDFLAFIRGCALMASKIKAGTQATDPALADTMHSRAMQDRVQHMRPIDTSIVVNGLEALKAFATDVSPIGFERIFCESMIVVLTSAQDSPQAGYDSWQQVFSLWHLIDSDELNRFVDRSNPISWALLAFFLALELVMMPICHGEWLEGDPHDRLPILLGVLDWSDDIFATVEGTPLEAQLEWPKLVVSTVRGELETAMQGGTWTEAPVLQLGHTDQLVIGDVVDNQSVSSDSA